MASMFSSATKLLESKRVQEAFVEFSSLTGSENSRKNANKLVFDASAFQFAQKLGMELFKAEKFAEARETCEIVMSWIRSKENGGGNLADTFSKSALNKSQLMKMEIWAALTAIQCLSKLASGDDDDNEMRAEALDLLATLKEASAKNLMEAAVVSSTAKKLRNVLISRKSLKTRILALKIAEDIQVDWEAECEKMLVTFVRDIRVKKEYSHDLESSLEYCFSSSLATSRSAKLTFDFGLWLNESKRPKDKVAKYLCSGCQTPKECLFAAKTASQSGEPASLVLALETAFQGLLNASDLSAEPCDPLIFEELLQLDVKLVTDTNNLNNSKLRLICEREQHIEGIVANLAAHEFDLALRMKRTETYLMKLRSGKSRSSLALLYEAKALRLLQKREESLRVLEEGEQHEMELLLLRSVLLAELGQVDQSYKCFCTLVRTKDWGVTPSQSFVQEALFFGWLMGYYEETMEYSLQVEASNASALVMPHLERFVNRSGTEASEAVEKHAHDADMAIRSLLRQASSRSAVPRPHLHEFEEVFRVVETLKVLGDLYKERGLSRLSRYYYSKALSVIKSRGLRGEEQRVNERMALLETMRTPRIVSFAGEGGIGIVDEDEDKNSDEQVSEETSDKKVSTTTKLVVDDAFERHFQDLHFGALSLLDTNRAPTDVKAPRNAFENLARRLVRADREKYPAWYETAVNALLVLRDARRCLDILGENQTNETDTLQAQALVHVLKDMTGLTETKRRYMYGLAVETAQRCTSDLVLLRQLYWIILSLGDKNDTHDRAYLASSLVGLTLRAERAQMLLSRKEEEELTEDDDDSNVDLFHWHRLERIADAARVQRSQVQSRLNEDWAVVTVAFDLDTRRLCLCRTERDTDIIVEVDQVSDEAIMLLEKFGGMMKRNLESTNGSTVEFAQTVGKTQKSKWWEERYELEEQLAVWLAEFEQAFLGWRAVLLRGKTAWRSSGSGSSTRTSKVATTASISHRHSMDEDYEVTRKQEKVTRPCAKTPNASVMDVFEEDGDGEQQSTSRQSKTAARSTKAATATARKTATTKKKNAQSAIYDDDDATVLRARKITFAEADDDHDDEVELSKRLSKTSIKPLQPAFTPTDVDANLEHALQEAFPANENERHCARICLTSGLKTSRIVEALVNLCPNRFQGNVREAEKFVVEHAVSFSEEDEEERHPLLLCLSGCLQQIPWESIPCLSGKRVSRIASLPFALERFPRSKNDARAFIVDPGNNLVRTQEALRPKLTELVNDPDQDWEGLIGGSNDKSETGAAFKQYLEEKSFVLYCGHGAGEEYLARDEIAKLKHCAPTFLMGCSSGSRKDLGWFEPNGVVDAYALARSPLVVGNLWNVTDRDIDRFTVAVLEGLQQGKTDLLGLVARNRKVCKLRMLVGAAPVCFGIPWQL